MSSPYREGAVFRLWECNDVVIDLDRVTMCAWSRNGFDSLNRRYCDGCGEDLPRDDSLSVLDVYVAGANEPYELSIDEGQSFLEAWRTYRRG